MSREKGENTAKPSENKFSSSNPLPNFTTG